ncbi:2' O-ribose methyltransferase, partial [Ophidiomyces ophidiicola]
MEFATQGILSTIGYNVLTWTQMVLYNLAAYVIQRSNPSKCTTHLVVSVRLASSSRWQSRQSRDIYRKQAIIEGLKSRAAFKLLQINNRHGIFKPGQTVGYAPGSWSQVAVDLTRPSGRVLGVDIIPAQPPQGVSTIQGNFLSTQVQTYVREFLRNPNRGRPRKHTFEISSNHVGTVENEVGYIDRERDASGSASERSVSNSTPHVLQGNEAVDVVLSDMSAPWQQITGFSKRSLSDPYHRMMNTSGIIIRDHARSMDLCRAALDFSFEVLKPGGHFICKFYQGNQDQELESKLKSLFHRVQREKPESSRK